MEDESFVKNQVERENFKLEEGTPTTEEYSNSQPGLRNDLDDTPLVISTEEKEKFFEQDKNRNLVHNLFLGKCSKYPLQIVLTVYMTFGLFLSVIFFSSTIFALGTRNFGVSFIPFSLFICSFIFLIAMLFLLFLSFLETRVRFDNERIVHESRFLIFCCLKIKYKKKEFEYSNIKDFVVEVSMKNDSNLGKVMMILKDGSRKVCVSRRASVLKSRLLASEYKKEVGNRLL